MTWLLAGMLFLLADLPFRCIEVPEFRSTLSDGTGVRVSRDGWTFALIQLRKGASAIPPGWGGQTVVFTQACFQDLLQTGDPLEPIRFEFDPPVRGMYAEVTQGGEGGGARIACYDARGTQVLGSYVELPCVQPEVCQLWAFAPPDYYVRVVACDVWAANPNDGAIAKVEIETSTPVLRPARAAKE